MNAKPLVRGWKSRMCCSRCRVVTSQNFWGGGQIFYAGLHFFDACLVEYSADFGENLRIELK